MIKGLGFRLGYSGPQWNVECWVSCAAAVQWNVKSQRMRGLCPVDVLPQVIRLSPYRLDEVEKRVVTKNKLLFSGCVQTYTYTYRSTRV